LDLSVIPGGTVGLLPDNETTPSLDGQIGPLLPMHAMSVHNTLLWKYNKPSPTMLMFHRHSAYRANEVTNPEVINFLLKTVDPVTGKTALADPANQLNSSFRRSFVQFCYGGYNIIHDVSQSVPTRIQIDQDLELAQLWDMNHPDAFKYDTKAPKYSSALLNNDDAELNIFAFRDMGFSAGLAYDMYCPGFSTLADGRVVFMGGHDMNSQNGNYRTQIFDPDTEKWANRPISCMRQQMGADPDDPFLEKKYQAEVDRLVAERLASGGAPYTDVEILREMSDFFLPVGNSLIGDCNPHLLDASSYSPTYPEIRLNSVGGTVTHPENPTSDMKYARWYPTSIALPNNSIFIYAGWDRDEKNAPEWPTAADPTNATTRGLRNFLAAKKADPTLYPAIKDNFKLAGELRSSGDAAFLASTYRQPVPEVYDAATDSTYALENARLVHFDWYPNGTVVQTGPGRNDWKVAVLDGEIYENVPGGYKPTTGAINETFPNGVQSRYFTKTWLVDVQGAMKDPMRGDPTMGAKVSDTQAGQYVTYLDKSFSNHTPFSGNANIIELDKLGNVVSHKLTQFGGAVVDRVVGQSNTSDTAEQIDFAPLSKRAKKGETIEPPKWKVLPGKLYQPGRQNYATPTPDGKIVILGGNGGTLPGIEAWSLHLQQCDPETGTVTKLAKSLVPRDEHGIIQLMPDATIYLGGQNRNGLVRSGDSAAPVGDSDLGVPSAQMFRPPYLFDASENPADRPMIAKAPAVVDYGKPFKVTAYSGKKITAVSLIRTGSMSHALNTDLRLVKVPFKQTGNTITVFGPKLPGTAIPGNYMLFVVDEDGVPSKAAKFTLGRDVEKRIKALKKAGQLTES
jgi:hypothetical protein